MDIIGSIDEQIELIDKQNNLIDDVVAFIFRSTFFNKQKSMKHKKCSLIDNKFVVSIGNNVKPFDGDKEYIATANVDGTDVTSIDSYVTYSNRPSRANNAPKANTIWFAKMKATSKKLLVLDNCKYVIESCLFSTGFQGVKVATDSISYFWSFLCSKEFEIIKDKMSSGATQQAIDETTLKKLNIPIPEDEILIKEFNDKTFMMLQKTTILKEKRKELIKYKNVLLPLLLNEQIS